MKIMETYEKDGKNVLIAIKKPAVQMTRLGQLFALAIAEMNDGKKDEIAKMNQSEDDVSDDEDIAAKDGRENDIENDIGNDIELIKSQTGCSTEVAKKEYERNDRDVVNTIISITYSK